MTKDARRGRIGKTKRGKSGRANAGKRERRRRPPRTRPAAAAKEATRGEAGVLRSLQAAIKALPEFFVLYGPDDRLVECNEKYRELNRAVAEATRPGVAFEDHIRALARKGLVPSAVGREEEWVAERLARHRDPKGPFELERQDGIWLLIHEQKLPGGGTATISTDISERKRAEQALTASEARFRAFVEHSPSDVHIKDAEGRYLVFSPGAAHRLGIKAADAIGKTARDLFPKDLAEAYAAQDREVLETGRAVEREHAALVNGELRTRLVTKFPIAGPAGGVVAIGSMSTDITERKRAEAALRQSEARFRAFIEHSPHRINMKDKDGRYLVFSRASARYWGVPAESALGKTPGDIYPRHLAKIFAAQDAEVLGTGRLLEYEDTYEKDGVTRTVLSTKFPVRDETGEIFALGIIGTDITARKEAEAASARLRDAIEHVEAGIALFDRDDRLVLCNERFARRLEPFAKPTVPGTLYSDMVRQTAATGILHPAMGDPESWIEKRLAYHRATPSRHEHQLRDGRWVELNEFRTRDGGALVIRTDITERKRDEEALRQSWELLQGVMDSVPAMVNAKDRQFRYVFMNRYQADLYGTTPEAAIGRTAGDLLGRDYGDYTSAIDRRVFESGEGVAYDEEDWIDCYGRSHALLTKKFPIRDARGEVSKVVTVGVDITDRRRAEQALKESEARLRAFIDHSPSALHIKDRDGRYLLFGPQAARNWGVRPEDAIGKTAHHIYPKDVADGVCDHDRAVLETRRPVERERILTSPEGPRALLVHKFPITDAVGGVSAIGTIVTDITERKKAEEALRRSDTRLRTLVDNFGSGILIHRNLKPLFANRALVEMFGYDGADEILALPTTESLIAPEDRAMLRAYHARRLRGEAAPVNYELRALRKDGSRMTLSNRPFPIDWDGERAICTVLFDVTEQKEMEEQLRHSQKMEAMGQLTGGIAHDLNNLLTVILGNLQLVRRLAAGNERLQKRVAAAGRSAERGADLMRRLLAFSRRQALDPRVSNLNDLMAGMEDMLRRTLGEDIEVALRLAPDLWLARVDGPQLESAVLNVAVNARDAMPGGGRLTVETENAVLDQAYAKRHAEVAPGSYAMVAVSDTGTGMPPDVFERAFEPFFTTKEVGRGTGLGLSMVYGFVKQSGGHIKIYSEPGRGTTVKLYFPRARVERTGAERRLLSGIEPEGALPRGRETVLVVEDQEDVRDFVTHALEELGYRVLTAADGRRALESLERHPGIALLFTDIVMPGGMGGRELAAVARQRRPGLKVLFTSGYTKNGVVRGDGGSDLDLLSKPYDVGLLAARVRQALDG
jgi:PAS domain S-box-containing protein